MQNEMRNAQMLTLHIDPNMNLRQDHGKTTLQKDFHRTPRPRRAETVPRLVLDVL